MLGELNTTGVKSLKAVRKIAGSIEAGAGWLEDEIKDAASLAKELNVASRNKRLASAMEDYDRELDKKRFRSAKARAKFEAKLASSGITLDMKAGE